MERNVSEENERQENLKAMADAARFKEVLTQVLQKLPDVEIRGTGVVKRAGKLVVNGEIKGDEA